MLVASGLYARNLLRGAALFMGVELRRIYNRARQESITKELLDIVGGAEALR